MQHTVRTHYDNLKVVRDAPPEVIQAAYRSLARKYHPDCNPGDRHAAQIMALINVSYDTLSDPVSRKEHDEWILRVETGTEYPFTQEDRFSGSPPPATKPKASAWLWPLCAIVGVIVGGLLAESRQPVAPRPPVYTPTVDKSPGRYVRPASAPNGEPWPTRARYVSGYQQLYADGLSSVTVKNEQGRSDVFAKLVSLDEGMQRMAVRTFFIPAGGWFHLDSVRAGRYDIRYQDLASGALSRSEPFTLEEVRSSEGIEYADMTLTLYRIRGGNMIMTRVKCPAEPGAHLCEPV